MTWWMFKRVSKTPDSRKKLHGLWFRLDKTCVKYRFHPGDTDGPETIPSAKFKD